VRGNVTILLPLNYGGLMSTLPYPEVVQRLRDLRVLTERMGSIADPFMYLSFLALPVIPSLRITDTGLFDAESGRNISLFSS